MRDRARIVIIGAGIAGTSTAYHLAKLGVTDVVVIDQGPLFRTGGSTSHAPGGMFQTNTSRTMSTWARYTIGLFAGLEVDGKTGAAFLGGIELAETAERLQEAKRRRGLQQSWGIPGEILTPSEVKKHIPIIDETKIHGGLYVPDDCIGRPLLAAEAMGIAARAAGIDFHGEVEVTGFERTNGRVSAVVTDKGRIEAEMVLCCAGIWGPKVGRLAGVPISLQPMQHQYVKTEDLPALTELSQGGTIESVMPLIRAQDNSLYFRQHFGQFGIGNYRHAPLPVDAETLLPFKLAPRMPSCMEFTPEHFEECHRATVNLFPLVKDVANADAFNGIFSFPPDGMPLMGEHAELPGFWVCEGVWITHSAGIGRSMAHWMIEGDPGVDIRESDVNRFAKFQTTRRYVNDRGSQQYREVYDIIHPLAVPTVARGLRTSPMHDRHLANGAHFWEVAGWERPAWNEANAHLTANLDLPKREGWAAYEWSPIQGAEALATRHSAGLYDISTFTKLVVEGPEAATFLNYVLANDVNKAVGQVVYTCMLNQRGGVMSDMVVTRTGEAEFLILTGTGSGLSDLAHMQRVARAKGLGADKLRIRNVTHELCGIGLWGPKAREILAAVSDSDVSDAGLPYYKSREITIGYVAARALRISYAGELGFELYVPAPHGRAAWDLLVAAGAEHGLVQCGIGALDSLRIEKGYRLAGADLTGDHTALEAGLGWSVNLKKGDFIGRGAIETQKAKGVGSKLCCITLDDPAGVLLGKEPVLKDGKPVAYVTSANYGYAVRKMIAYAYLPVELATTGEALEVEYLGQRFAATVANDPLYDPEGKKLRA
ncbi:GcvT family protein [Chthonobacter albigriseus]|uniref:GcvT family protein n=1 Tax=Chthonobacter albigriseus TaxID=1683161 RepID=UPI0015EE6193|nr:FAD-dependent oxidoreductase [Chthonobacter albigriseus]